MPGARGKRPAGPILYNAASPQAHPSLMMWYAPLPSELVSVRSKAPFPAISGTQSAPGGVGMAPSPLGGSAFRPTSTGGYLILGTHDSIPLPTTQVTIAMTYRKTDVTLRASVAFGLLEVSGVNGRIGVHLPYSDGLVYWDFGPGVEGTSRLSVNGLTFGEDTWVFTAGPRGMEIWQNGIKRASNSGTSTRSPSTGSYQFALFGGQGSPGAIAPDNAECTDFRMYSQQLSPSLCQHLSSRNTRWDLYTMPTRRASFDRAAAVTDTGISPFRVIRTSAQLANLRRRMPSIPTTPMERELHG